jgi:3-phosphoshikimate 1-carboxyvinyltransferase
LVKGGLSWSGLAALLPRPRGACQKECGSKSDDMAATQATRAARAARSGPLKGEVRAPGDKSISHRALILGALAEGDTRIKGLLEADDVLRTAAALRALGAEVEREPSEQGATWRVVGGAWRAPPRALYFGNSGTGARLAVGACAGRGIAASFDGDQSLRARPMTRVLEPLRRMGVVAQASEGRLPASLAAGAALRAIDYALPKPSAQVKSAILLAALGAEGETIVRESEPSRDHTERMLKAFAAKLEVAGDGARVVRLKGPQSLRAAGVAVPGDPSSAAFLVAAALIVPGSDVLVRDVCVNPLRAGFYETIREMGADIAFENRREAGGEPVADIRARHSRLKGVAVLASRAPSMIDEYPILGVLAAFADGETRMEGLGELRVKESDRLAAIEAGLAANGVKTKSGPDWLKATGLGEAGPAGGGHVVTRMDHRIAMSFLVMGLAARARVEIDDASMIATSFPDFFELIERLGAVIR